MATGGDEAAALGRAEDSDQESDDFRILSATETNATGKFEWVGSESLPENPSTLQEVDEADGRGGEAPADGGESTGGVAQEGTVRSFMDVEKLSKAKISARMMITNSKSHNWVFGAVSELVDNSKDAGAETCTIDVHQAQRPDAEPLPVLTISDDGSGLRSDELLEMLSTGFCDKQNKIGEYGNGLKSSSMRIGDDCLVFTFHAETGTFSVGLYSHTMHSDAGLQEIRLPCLAFSLEGDELRPVYGAFGGGEGGKGSDSAEAKQAHVSSLSALGLYTPYGRKTMAETEAELKRRLLEVFPAVKRRGRGAGRASGTLLELYNLKDDLILDGVGDDIHQNHTRHTIASYSQPKPLPLDTSLYEYLRLLYLDPGMQIVLRGREVEQWHLGTLEGRLNFFAGDSLEDMPYKPALSAGPDGPKVPVHIGIRKFFNAKGEFALDETEYGTLIYHKRRLIRALDHWGIHGHHSGLGVGVVLLATEDFLDVSHNKQGYTENSDYNKFKKAMADRLRQYCEEMVAEEKLSLDTSRRLTLMTTARKEYEEFEANVQRMIEVNNNLSANLQAVRCDDCFTWRFMPEEYEAPEGEWTCTNADHVKFNPEFASCDAPPQDPTLTEDPWRKQFVNEMGWRYLVERISNYMARKHLVVGVNANGTFDDIRLGEIAVRSDREARHCIPYSVVRTALKAAVVQLEGIIKDGSSRLWINEADMLPPGGSRRSATGPWGALLALARRWSARGKGAGGKRTAAALEKAVNQQLTRWAAEDEEEERGRVEVEQEAQEALQGLLRDRQQERSRKRKAASGAGGSSKKNKKTPSKGKKGVASAIKMPRTKAGLKAAAAAKLAVADAKASKAEAARAKKEARKKRDAAERRAAEADKRRRQLEKEAKVKERELRRLRSIVEERGGDDGEGRDDEEGAGGPSSGRGKQASARAIKKAQKAIKAAVNPGPPVSWPDDCYCEFSSCMVWGDPNSASEKLRQRNSRKGTCMAGVEVRSKESFYEAQGDAYGLFSTVSWVPGERIGAYIGAVTEVPADEPPPLCGPKLLVVPVDAGLGLVDPSGTLLVDATQVGNEARFIHDCPKGSDPNIEFRVELAGPEFCVGVYAVEAIEEGDELRVSYKAPMEVSPEALVDDEWWNR